MADDGLIVSTMCCFWVLFWHSRFLFELSGCVEVSIVQNGFCGSMSFDGFYLFIQYCITEAEKNKKKCLSLIFDF